MIADWNPRSACAWLSISLFIPIAGLQAQVDPRGNWRTWHTTHFRVHARAEHGNVALVAASEAERAYAALAAELRPPRGIVDIVLYDNVDFSNGYATFFPSNRISVFLTPPASEIGLGRYDRWLRLVLTHELTHLFHLDRAEGIWRVLQRVFGRAPLFFPNAYRPGWVGEGLATYYESRLTAGGRGRGAFHSQVVLAGASDGRWPNPADVNFASSRWPAASGPYAFGSRFFQWEASAHGDSVVPRFIERTSRRLWPLTISGPLKQAGGDGLGTDWGNFRKHWEDRAPSVTRSRVIARGLRAEPRPRLSRDGKRLAYVTSDGRTRERLLVRDIQTGREIASQVVNGAPEIAWIGEDLVFAELDFTTPVEIRTGLYRWTPGGALARLTPVPRLTRPFTIGEAIGAVLLGPSSTVVVEVGNPGVDSIAVPPADDWGHVAVSPDGRQFAAARHAHEQWDIVVWPAGSPSQARLITDDAALDDDPLWSPDGKTVIFTSERAGMPQIYAFDIHTSALRQLTDEPNGAREGELAPDGTVFFSTVLHDGYAVLSRVSGAVETAPALNAAAPAVLQPQRIDAPERPYSPWQSLAPRFWLPLYHDEGGGVGRFLGAATSGTDVVGRTGYTLAVAHAINNPRWEGYFSIAHTRWSAASVDLSATQLWDAGGSLTLPDSTTALLAERDRSLNAGVTIRQRRWRSDASARIVAELSQDAFFEPTLTVASPTFMGGSVSAFAGSIHRQALSISAEDGVQINGLYRQRWALDGGGSHEIRGTVRGYLGLPLPGFARWVLAGRVAAAMSGGSYARNYALGGESGGTFTVIPGVGFGGGTRDFGLRGYPRDISRFTRVVVSAAEVRIPLFLIGRAIWKLPLMLDKVSLSLFAEGGGGWRQASGSRGVAQYRDVGAELVFDLGLNLDSPVRLRVGGAQAQAAGLGAAKGDWRGYVALGSSF